MSPQHKLTQRMCAGVEREGQEGDCACGKEVGGAVVVTRGGVGWGGGGGQGWGVVDNLRLRLKNATQESKEVPTMRTENLKVRGVCVWRRAGRAGGVGWGVHEGGVLGCVYGFFVDPTSFPTSEHKCDTAVAATGVPLLSASAGPQ